ncbi:MAG: hypothetical protein A2202_04330 [Bdellovibrionales bacterium RIFOXYA1_FULL_36_14]|nr:MAG: hypothetical protein A2202_04330 [Bdellovibrionales bacterium RIFOXYA1_FULL_36_14]
MKRDLILINPFKSIVPRKLLERINKDDIYYITEVTTLTDIKKFAEEKATGVAVWFVSRSIQLKKNLTEFNELNKEAIKWYMKVVLITGDGSLPKIRTEATIIPLSRANQELLTLLDNHFGERERMQGKEESLKKNHDSQMATVLLGGSKKSKNATLSLEVNSELENIFGNVNLSSEMELLDAKLAKVEGRYHPLHDADADPGIKTPKVSTNNKPSLVKNPKLDLEKSFLDLLSSGTNDELSEIFNEITEKEEKKDYLQDLCENCPHINLWSPRGLLDINCFLKINHGVQEEFVLKWVMNKKGVEFEKQIGSGEWSEICIRGNIDKGGLFFLIKNPKDYYQENSLKIPVPEMIWKVERREFPRLKFLSFEKTLLKKRAVGGAQPDKKWRVSDISESGIKIYVENEDKKIFQVDTLIDDAVLELEGREIKFKAQIKWFEDIGFVTISKRVKLAAGVSFASLAQTDKEFIKQYIHNKLQIQKEESFDELLSYKQKAL